jgi:hypothetical protein
MPAAYYDGAPVDRIRVIDGASSLRGRRKVMPLLDTRQQEFIEFVLSRYVQDGVAELDMDKLTALLELKYRAVTDAVEPSVWKLKLSKAGMWIAADVSQRSLALAGEG